MGVLLYGLGLSSEPRRTKLGSPHEDTAAVASGVATQSLSLRCVQVGCTSMLPVLGVVRTTGMDTLVDKENRPDLRAAFRFQDMSDDGGLKSDGW